MTTNATRRFESDASPAGSTEVEPAWPCPECGSADYNWQTSGAYAYKSCEDCGHLEVRR
jgi:predicted RNA-binding Zn-ribbon protein involved in translation (DUF1610 family)